MFISRHVRPDSANSLSKCLTKAIPSRPLPQRDSRRTGLLVQRLAPLVPAYKTKLGRLESVQDDCGRETDSVSETNAYADPW